MSEALWAPRPRPTPGPDASTLGQWQLAMLADLTAHRLELAAALHDGGRPAGADEGAVERLLLAFEELVSNALRHGRGPVAVAVTTTGSYWLLEFSDVAPHVPPTPAVGRDAAQGGLGLYLVARICGAHGWTVDGHRKLVWARIDYTRAEAPGIRTPPPEAGRRRQPRAVILPTPPNPYRRFTSDSGPCGGPRTGHDPTDAWATSRLLSQQAERPVDPAPRRSLCPRACCTAWSSIAAQGARRSSVAPSAPTARGGRGIRPSGGQLLSRR